MSITTRSDYIWMNGEFIRWEDANIHISTHALHYGTSIFEGARCYSTPEGPAVFRLPEHTHRLFNSAKIARMPFTRWSEDEVNDAIVGTIARNGLDSCYIRPIGWKHTPALGVGTEGETHLAIMVWEWGEYLGEGAVENGIDAAVSSWRRPAHGTYTPMGKIGGQYVNNVFAVLEARRGGYTEAIELDVQGLVSEGSGENIFCVMDGTIYTPPLAAGILSGITRDSVVKITEHLGMPLQMANLSREMLYICDELFMTGTAAEITPVRSVDGIEIGSGKRGEMTRQIQETFFAIVKGEMDDIFGWRTLVHPISEAAGD